MRTTVCHTLANADGETSIPARQISRWSDGNLGPVTPFSKALAMPATLKVYTRKQDVGSPRPPCESDTPQIVFLLLPVLRVAAPIFGTASDL